MEKLLPTACQEKSHTALELKTGNAAKDNRLERKHIISISGWGGLRNAGRVESSDSLRIDLYDDDKPAKQIQMHPEEPLIQLARQTKGLGPTYLSKVLRFALPQEYGALDTRLLRVIGIGDAGVKCHDWLDLKVRNDGNGWYIPRNQPAWPGQYSKWINILRFLAYWLNTTDSPCPHPPHFVTCGLRKGGIWACADVEMASFSYASKYV